MAFASGKETCGSHPAAEYLRAGATETMRERKTPKKHLDEQEIPEQEKPTIGTEWSAQRQVAHNTRKEDYFWRRMGPPAPGLETERFKPVLPQRERVRSVQNGPVRSTS